MKNIVLVGFMGTGKTAIGGLLAQHFDVEFVQTDPLIEKKENMPINDIFAKKGESYFREVEKEIVEKVSKKENIVIDAGGGVVIDASNVENLKKNGVIFCLNAAPEEILNRIGKHKHRPLLNTDDPLSKIKELLEKRREYYKRADYQIDTNGKTPTRVSEEIIGIYKRQTE